MNHIAIDLGSINSQVCIRQSDGTIIQEEKVRTDCLGDLLGQLEPGRVIVETCAESLHVVKQAKAVGHDVRLVPSTLAPELGVGRRGIKTDIRDARHLSEASCKIDLGSVHIPKDSSMLLKQQCGARDSRVKARTMLINTVRGWLRQSVLRPKSGVTSTFPARVMALMESEQLDTPLHIASLLTMITHLSEQIKAADVTLLAWCKQSELATRLMTVPGVGPITTVRFIASIDTVERFPNAHRVQSYLGLTPGERSSGTKQHRTGITKAGAAATRRVLVQAAWVIKRTQKGSPLVDWNAGVEYRRGKQISAVAMARKLAGILFVDDTRHPL